MREENLYVCDFCGVKYKDKEECFKCEKTHKAPCSITNASFIPYKDDASGYPQRIEVLMHNGERKWYYRLS